VTTTQEASAPATGPDAPSARGRRPLAAVAGLLSAGVALGVGELAAGLIGPQSSPVVAVGDKVITLVPEPVKAFAIAAFGEDDKIALVVGTLVVIALYALAIGVLALRRRAVGVAGIAVFGVVGAAAAVTGPAGGPLDALPSLVGRPRRHRRAAGAAGPAHRRGGGRPHRASRRRRGPARASARRPRRR
jgi:hypothetical protein